jgi:transcription elongation factor GreA
MTAVLDHASRHQVLTRRLDALHAQRREIQAEIAPTMVGDDADRATNVDGHVRLAMLEDRIAAVELARADAARQPEQSSADAVREGAVVTVDLGDGPETFLFASVEQAAAGDDVITPGSPLGRALAGAAAGATVEYRAANRTRQAAVIAVA